MNTSAFEQRLDRMETEIRQIKMMLSELLEITKAAFQSHAQENIMSAKEVADFLRLDINVIYAKCAKSEMPHFKMGKLYKFKKSEILEWVKRQDSLSTFSVDDYVDRYLQANMLKG
jgi:excisionase family DNA binding protein